jgi:hypothetical protein
MPESVTARYEAILKARRIFLYRLVAPTIIATLLVMSGLRFALGDTKAKPDKPRASVTKIDTLCAQFLQLGRPSLEPPGMISFIIRRVGVERSDTTILVPRSLYEQHRVSGTIMDNWYNFLYMGKDLIDYRQRRPNRPCLPSQRAALPGGFLIHGSA